MNKWSYLPPHQHIKNYLRHTGVISSPNLSVIKVEICTLCNQIKIKLLKTLVWLVALYGSESWTHKANDIDKSKAFEMTCYRRKVMLWISWMDHRSAQTDIKWTETEALVLRSLLEDRGRITESIRILVPVDRTKQKCFQITTKQVRRQQQFQLRQ